MYKNRELTGNRTVWTIYVEALALFGALHSNCRSYALACTARKAVLLDFFGS